MSALKIQVYPVLSLCEGFGFDRYIETAQRYEAEGVANLSFTDHLLGLCPESAWTEEYTPLAKVQSSPDVFYDAVSAIAAVAMATKRVGLHLMVTESFRRHPALIAQEALTLDHISKGRFVLGLGSGEGENIIPYGMDFKKPVSRLEEALRIIRLLWSTDQPVNFDGAVWKLRNAVLGLRPYGAKPPEIWLAANGPRMIDMCAQYADGWVPVMPAVDDYGRKLKLIKETAAQKYGRDLSNMPASMTIFGVILDRHEDTHRLMETTMAKCFGFMIGPEVFQRYGIRHPLGDNFNWLHDFVPSEISREQFDAAAAQVPFSLTHKIIFHGTPDEVCERLERYAEQGMTHVQMQLTTSLFDHERLAESIDGLTRVAKYFS